MDHDGCNWVRSCGQVHYAGIVENFGQMLILGPFFIILEVSLDAFSSVYFRETQALFVV